MSLALPARVCLALLAASACHSDGDSVLEAPEGVEASDGTVSTHVIVRWSPSVGASAYRVFRDGELAGEVDTTSLIDGNASAPSIASAPIATATQGTETDRVVVRWSPATTDPGAVHEYTVTALDEEGESEPSLPDDGHRGAVGIFTYELSIDEEPFTAVGRVTSFDDRAAPAGTIVTGTALATQGVYSAYVSLAIACVPPPGASAACASGNHSRSVPGATRAYEVRAITGAGPGPVSAVTGFRGAGPLVVQWERSSQDADASYIAIAGANTESFDDAGAPETEPRFYRCRLSADGTQTVITNAARGWRGAAP